MLPSGPFTRSIAKKLELALNSHCQEEVQSIQRIRATKIYQKIYNWSRLTQHNENN